MPFFATLEIPGNYSPFERGDLFEDPLVAAFRKAGRVATCTGGGSQLGETDDGLVVTRVDVELSIKDLPKALDVLRKTLPKLKAPAGTTVTLVDPKLELLKVTKSGVTVIDKKKLPAKPPRRPSQKTGWKVGQIVRVMLDAKRFSLLHVLTESGPPLVRVLDWVGTDMPTQKEMAKLCRAKARYAAIEDPFHLFRDHGDEAVFALFRPTEITVPAKPLGPLVASSFSSYPMLPDMLRKLHGIERMTRDEQLQYHLGWFDGDHHIAIWDAPGKPSRADVDGIVLAYARKLRPLPPMPVTTKLEAAIDELKQMYPGRPRSQGSPFRAGFNAREGFVMIPIWAERIAEVWRKSRELSARHGVQAYHVNTGRLATTVR